MRNKRRFGWIVPLVLVLIFSVGSVSAVTRLQKLKDDRYLITLKKLSAFGGQGKILRQLNVKTASLCVLLNYEWYEISNVESHGRGFAKTAAGTFEVRFYHEEQGDDSLSCEALATDEEKEKMKKALDKLNP